MFFKYRPLSWLAVVVIAIGLMPVKTGAESALPYLELTRPDRGKVFAVAWSPDGQYVAVGTEQGLWLYTDTFADVLHVTDKPIHALAWSPDGQVIATGYFGKWVDVSMNGPVTYSMQGGGLPLWSVKKTKQRFTLVPRTMLLKDGAVYAMRFSPDSRTLASLSQDIYLHPWQDVLRIYEVKSGILLHEFDSETWLRQDEAIIQGASGLAWSHDGRYLASIDAFVEGKNRYFSIWDSVREQFVVTPGLDECTVGIGSITSVDWRDGDAQVAFSGVFSVPTSEGGVRVGYWEDRQVPCQNPLLGESQDGYRGVDIFALAWRPGSQWLAYTEGTAIQLWDAAAKQPVARLDAARDDVTMLAWSADGLKLLASGSDYAVRIWTRFATYHSPDPRPVREITLVAKHSDGVLSPDGQWIAAVNQTSGLVEVISAFNGSVRRSFDTRADQPRTQIKERDILLDTTASWSPDNSMLAIWLSPKPPSLSCTSLSQYAVQLWSVQSGKLIRSWDSVTSLAWRPDSRAVAVGIVKSYQIHTTKAGDGFPVDVGSFEVRDAWTGQVVEEAPLSEQWGEVLKTSRYSDIYDESGAFYLEHLLSVSHWSPDGRLLAIDDRVGCGVYGNVATILWDTQSHGIATQLDVWRRDVWGGSGDSAEVRAWSPDGHFVLAQGINQVFFYRLHRQGDKVTPELIWRHPGGCGEIVFSLDSRYFLCNDTVWDTGSGWPVFRFRAPMLYRTYRWIGDMLTGYDFGSVEDNRPGKAVSWRASDFLPK